MTSEERERMFELCRKIETEEDQQKFIQLIEELNKFLEGANKKPGME
jgi:hypothetical protein